MNVLFLAFRIRIKWLIKICNGMHRYVEQLASYVLPCFTIGKFGGQSFFCRCNMLAVAFFVRRLDVTLLSVKNMNLLTVKVKD